MPKVLITGGAGGIASCIAEGLEEAGGYTVVRADIQDRGKPGILIMDVGDYEAVRQATEDVDIIIHLAFNMFPGSLRGNLIPTNIHGTWNIYEAAHRNGVKRVIFGSSNHVVGFFKRGEVPTDGRVHRPDSTYALCKSFSELCGSYFSDRYGMSVINVRIGSFPHDPDHLPYSRRRCRTWLSPGDCKQLFLRCVQAPNSVKFLTIYGMSANSGGDFNVSKFNEAIGYVPQDDGMDHLQHAMDVDLFKSIDENGFLGADMVLFDPFENQFEPEYIHFLNQLHGLPDETEE